MKFEVKNGDVLLSEEEVIAHGVNCQGVMGSGVALAIRTKWPSVFRDYLKACTEHRKNKMSPLGMIAVSEIADKRYVANMFTQEHFGYDGKQYTDMEALRSCLVKLKNMRPQSVAIPYGMCSVRGGANWDDVVNLIKEVFEETEVNFVAYKLN